VRSDTASGGRVVRLRRTPPVEAGATVQEIAERLGVDEE
jgi:hypothetical protein